MATSGFGRVSGSGVQHKGGKRGPRLVASSQHKGGGIVGGPHLVASKKHRGGSGVPSYKIRRNG